MDEHLERKQHAKKGGRKDLDVSDHTDPVVNGPSTISQNDDDLPRKHASSSQTVRQGTRKFQPPANGSARRQTIMISGAANGLGAAFLQAYQAQEEVDIIAIDRSPFLTTHSNVHIITVDVQSEDSINRFVQEIKDRPIDLVIHSAGIRGLVPHVENEKPNDVAACETLDVMDMATLIRAFSINAAGTFMLLRALLPNLRRADDAKVVVMASRMGSIGNNELPNKDAGSAYAYRASKAATNAVVRSFAVDVPEVTFIVCHPGRVETNLVRCIEEGAISAVHSVASIMPLIDRWEKKDSGKFYDRFGEPIPW